MPWHRHCKINAWLIPKRALNYGSFCEGMIIGSVFAIVMIMRVLVKHHCTSRPCPQGCSAPHADAPQASPAATL